MALAERDSQMNSAPATAWAPIRNADGLTGWPSVVVIVATLALLVVGVAFVARKLGLRRRLSWLFALGVGMWLWAPFAADSAAGGLLAAAGLLMMPCALVAEILLRRRDLDTDTIR